MDDLVNRIRELMAEAFRRTPVAGLGGNLVDALTGGKLLRARLGVGIGRANGLDPSFLADALAAVELAHAASLLHDDVIDGGVLRRGAPAFWVEKGAAGAILLGDLVVCRALERVIACGDGRVTAEFVRATAEMCEAEAEQELVLRNGPASWDQCIGVARRKTGSLFALAAWIAAGADAVLGDALREAGYRAGTAYQLADDLADAGDGIEEAGKFPGADRRRGKPTCATSWQAEGIDPLAVIRTLCRDAESGLAPWPDIRQAWRVYQVSCLDPALERATRHVQPHAVS